MAQRNNRQNKRSKIDRSNMVVAPRVDRLRTFVPANQNQDTLYNELMQRELVIATGPAGSGKSYAICAAAARLYEQGLIDEIVLTRNPLPTGQSVGFFPGTAEEKMALWLAPVLNTMKKVCVSNNGSAGFFNYLLEKRVIRTVPLETLKGSSFDRTFVILEEAQENTLEDLVMLATRIGDYSKLAMSGDVRQVNSKLRSNGLSDFCSKIRKFDQDVENRIAEDCARQNTSVISDVSEEWELVQTPIVEFTKADSVTRSLLTRKMVEIFY